jgi:hypothetical protein
VAAAVKEAIGCRKLPGSREEIRMDLALVMSSLSMTQLQQAVGIQLLDVVKDQQRSQANSMLRDFVQTQRQILAAAHPYLGKHLDVYV